MFISPYRGSFEWLTTKGRRDYFSATLLYRLLKKDSKFPQYLRVRSLPNDSTRHTRGDRPPLKISSFTKEFLERSFYVTTSCLWNSLPSEIHNSSSLHSFKKRLCILRFTWWWTFTFVTESSLKSHSQETSITVLMTCCVYYNERDQIQILLWMNYPNIVLILMLIYSVYILFI